MQVLARNWVVVVSRSVPSNATGSIVFIHGEVLAIIAKTLCKNLFCEVALLMMNFFSWQEEGVEFTQPVAQIV